jgi:peroxiredoxin
METRNRLQFNELAPDVEVKTTAGETIRLSSLWSEKPLLLAFTRHFGCPQCKEILSQLVDAKAQIEAAGLAIAAVTQGSPAQTLEFGRHQAPGILCLSDAERRAYHAYGLERGNLWQVILSPRVVAGTARAKKHGHTAELPPSGQDAMQMSGTFIIGTDGRIRLPYYYDNIADHPPVELLLNGVLSTGWDKPFKGALG